MDYAEGIKLTDPRRMAVYFAKYSTAGCKEYQHQVPREWITSYLVYKDCGRDYDQARDDCPDCGCLEAELVDTGSAGRFWGYRGLRPVLAVRSGHPGCGDRRRASAAPLVPLQGPHQAGHRGARGTVHRLRLLPTLSQAQTAFRPATAGSSLSTTLLPWPLNSLAISPPERLRLR